MPFERAMGRTSRAFGRLCAAASSTAVGLPEEQLRFVFSTFVVGLGLHAMRAARRIKKWGGREDDDDVDDDDDDEEG